VTSKPVSAEALSGVDKKDIIKCLDCLPLPFCGGGLLQQCDTVTIKSIFATIADSRVVHAFSCFVCGAEKTSALSVVIATVVKRLVACWKEGLD